MFCEACGRPMDDGLEHCNHCGAKINTNGVVKIPSVRNKVFAYIGLGLSINALVISLIPYVSFSFWVLSIPSLVFSKYGIDSTKEKVAKTGKILSILSIIFGILVSVLLILLKDLRSNRY